MTHSATYALLELHKLLALLLGLGLDARETMSVRWDGQRHKVLRKPRPKSHIIASCIPYHQARETSKELLLLSIDGIETGLHGLQRYEHGDRVIRLGFIGQ